MMGLTYRCHRLARAFDGDKAVEFRIVRGWREGWGDDSKVVGVSLYLRRSKTLRMLTWR